MKVMGEKKKKRKGMKLRKGKFLSELLVLLILISLKPIVHINVKGVAPDLHQCRKRLGMVKTYQSI